MGEPAFKEGGVGQQPQSAVKAAEEILKGLGLTITPRKAASPELEKSLNEANETVGKCKDMAKRIDNMFGLSDKQARERLEEDLGHLRKQLDGIDPRYREQVLWIQKGLDEIQLLVAGAGTEGLSSAKERFSEVQDRIGRLSEVITTARGLVAAGAPQELVSATEGAAAFLGTPRAELILHAASIFIDNSYFLTSEGGSKSANLLLSYVNLVSDVKQEIDLEKARAGLAEFERGFGMSAEQIKADIKEFRKTYAAAGTVANGVAGAAEQRLAAGDLKGARMIMDMGDQYLTLAQSGRKLPGLEDIKAALDAEMRGENAIEQFTTATNRYGFGQAIDVLRKETTGWGVIGQRGIAAEGLGKAEELVRSGDFEGARRLLTMELMYVDTVARLGVRKGQALSLSAENSTAIAGMGNAMTAAAAGRQIEGKKPEDVFIPGYAIATRGIIEQETQRLEKLASDRPVGADVVMEALQAARQRASEGDARGAFTLLQYVNDYYGVPAAQAEGRQVRAEGWRYGIFAGKQASAIPGYAQGRDQMLAAIGMEIAAKSEDGHAAAADAFATAAKLVVQTESRMHEFGIVRQKYNGTMPWIGGVPETTGKVPLGDRQPDGKYAGYLELADIRKYEAMYPHDPVLRGGHTLAQLFAECESAAAHGDEKGYAKALSAFNERFELVAARLSRQQGIGRALAQLDQISETVGKLKAAYGPEPPAEIAERFQSLSSWCNQVKAEVAALQTAKGATAEFPQHEYADVLAKVGKERNLALSHQDIQSQMELSREYRAMMGKSITGADLVLQSSEKKFEEARQALLKGNEKETMEKYNDALYDRQVAMGLYRAKSGRRGIGEWVVAKPFENWRESRLDIFRRTLEGTALPASLALMALNPGLIEMSIFSVPVERGSNMFTDFSKRQQEIIDLVAQGKYLRAARVFNNIKYTLEVNQIWTSTATMALGIVTMPMPLVSGAIFLSLATQQAMTEAAATGKLSWQTWLMLGVTFGTIGLGGVASVLRTATMEAKATASLLRATSPEAAGIATVRAGQLGAWGTGVTVSTIGIGGAYGLYTGIEAWRGGLRGDAIFNVGMALFPFVHMVGGRIAGRRAGAHAQSEITFDEAIAEMRAKRAAAAREIAPAGVKPAVAELPQAAAKKPAPLRTEQEVYDNYMKEEGGGMLPADITPREWRYVRERTGGATHPEAMAIISERAKGPTAAERLRERRERTEEAKKVSRSTADKEVSDEMLRNAILDWSARGELIVGGEDTARIMRCMEDYGFELAEQGEQVCFISGKGDKKTLNLLNGALGREHGNLMLDGYWDVGEAAAAKIEGTKHAIFIRARAGSDETLFFLIVRGDGKGLRTRLEKAFQESTAEVYKDYSENTPIRSLLEQGLVEPTEKLIAGTWDIADPIVFRELDGKMRPFYRREQADGSVTFENAMKTRTIRRPDGTEMTHREYLPEQLHDAETKGSGSHTLEIARRLNLGKATEIHNAKNILDVGEAELVNGVVFDMRYAVLDSEKGTLNHMREDILPETEKGKTEVEANRFGPRGENTMFGHDPTNWLVNQVELGLEKYVELYGVKIKRLGTQKYVIEGGSAEQVAQIRAFVNGRFQSTGAKLTVCESETRVLSNASKADALAEVSNGHLKISTNNGVEWNGKQYEVADSIISAMKQPCTLTLLRRLAGADYESLLPIRELVRKNPAIRTYDDLFMAINDLKKVNKSAGNAMESAYRNFVEARSDAFLEARQKLAPKMVRKTRAENAAIPFAKAVGAEEMSGWVPEVGRERVVTETPRAQRPAIAKPGIETLESAVGAKPRGAELEGALKMLATEEERAVARVLDAIMAGEVKGKLPPEYQRVIDSIGKEGRGKAGEAAAPAERAFIVIASVPDVITARSMAALERAMVAQNIVGELNEDAVILLKTIKTLPLRADEMRMSERDHFAVMERIQRGIPEADAVIRVVTEKKAAYEEALAALRSQQELAESDVGLATSLLRSYYGRKMSTTDQKAITDRAREQFERHLDEGKGDIEAVIATAKQVRVAEQLVQHHEELLPMLQERGARQNAETYLLSKGFEKDAIETARAELLVPRHEVSAESQRIFNALLGWRHLFDFGGSVSPLMDRVRNTMSGYEKANKKRFKAAGLEGGLKSMRGPHTTVELLYGLGGEIARELDSPLNFGEPAHGGAEKTAVRPADVGQAIGGFEKQLPKVFQNEKFVQMYEKAKTENALLEWLGRMEKEVYPRNFDAAAAKSIKDPELREYLAAGGTDAQNLVQAVNAYTEASAFRQKVADAREKPGSQPPTIGNCLGVVERMQDVLQKGLEDLVIRVDSKDGRIAYNMRITPKTISHLTEGHPMTPENFQEMFTGAIGAQPYMRAEATAAAQMSLPKRISFGEIDDLRQRLGQKPGGLSEDAKTSLTFSRLNGWGSEDGYTILAGWLEGGAVRPLPGGRFEVDLTVGTLYTKKENGTKFFRMTVLEK